MAATKVLTIELGGTAGLADAVRDVLASARHSPELTLKHWRFGQSVNSIKEMTDLVQSFDPRVVLLVAENGLLLQVRFLLKAVTVPVVIISEDYGAGEIMDLLRLGATDFITAPVRAQDLLPRIWRLLSERTNDDSLTDAFRTRLGLERLVGRNTSFTTEVKKIPVVARCDVSVLITGETGTGKELCARAIHYLSPRGGKPFVAVNCGAIPFELAENELFGHAKGAFTGADSSEPGLIAEADGGTLFLDDVDCLLLQTQVKLLRFLQEKEYKPLGSSKSQKADVRILASSNGDLAAAVEEGRFRRDLFYRLSVIPLRLPALRERLDDIQLLAHHFLKKYAAEFGKDVSGFAENALGQLAAHEWKGNVRELENVIERAIVFATGSTVEEVQLSHSYEVRSLPSSLPESLKEAKARAIEEFEKGYIERLLTANGGNITHAARAAHKNRRAFFELMRKHRIIASPRTNGTGE